MWFQSNKYEIRQKFCFYPELYEFADSIIFPMRNVNDGNINTERVKESATRIRTRTHTPINHIRQHSVCVIGQMCSVESIHSVQRESIHFSRVILKVHRNFLQIIHDWVVICFHHISHRQIVKNVWKSKNRKTATCVNPECNDPNFIEFRCGTNCFTNWNHRWTEKVQNAGL